MALNVELAERVLARIDADRASFNMGDWARANVDSAERGELCEATLCIAGHSMVESGEYEVAPHPVFGATIRSVETGEVPEFEETARRLLGLTIKMAELLFYCPDDEAALDLLRGLVAEAKAGRS